MLIQSQKFAHGLSVRRGHKLHSIGREANFGGDLNLPQIAFGAGCLDERFRDHLIRCGYKF